MCRRSTAPLSRVCSGQVILATGLLALQYRCSAALGVSPAFMCMRPELTVIPDHILRDALFRFVERCVTGLGDPFRFQSSEEALHWTVVPTVAAPTHALHHLIPPQLLPERQAGKQTTKIGME